MFIPDDMQPKVKKLTESYLDEIFLFGEGTVVSLKDEYQECDEL